MKLNILLSLVFFASTGWAQTVTVFKSNPNYKKGTRFAKNQYFRIPSVVTIKESKYLVAFAEERLGSTGDSGDINVVYKYSKNHGKTWSPMYRLCELGQDTCGNPTAVVDQSTQRVHIFMSGNKGYKRQFNPRDDRERYGYGDRWVLYSSGKFKNGHLTFGAIQDFTDELQPPKTRFDAVGPGVGIDIERGPYKGRLVIPATRRYIYSDDAGKTWQMSEVHPSKGISESAIAEMRNGDIFRSDRMTGHMKGVKRRITSISDDGGESLGPIGKDPLLLDPQCQGSLLTYTASRVIHANCATTGGELAGHSNRRFLTLRLTSDGENWKRSVRINKECGYSSMTKTRDWHIGILWEKPASDPQIRRQTHKAKDLVFQKFSLKDLGFQ